METRTTLCKCLDCGHELDAVTDPSGQHKPSPDDITICLYCGHIMAFAADLSVRPLTDSEMYSVAGNRNVIRIQRAIKEARR